MLFVALLISSTRAYADGFDRLAEECRKQLEECQKECKAAYPLNDPTGYSNCISCCSEEATQCLNDIPQIPPIRQFTPIPHTNF
jgi:hypothetical protein